MTTENNEVLEYPEMECFLNESLSDVVFVIDGQRIPAIKSTLGLKSRVFRAMFSGKFSESKETEESKLPEIEIKDTTFDAFKTLIRFIYTEQMVFKDTNDFEHISEVYRLSDRYEVLRLRRKVVHHLEFRIKVEYINDLTSIARIAFSFNIEDLMTKVMAFIDENINEVIKWDLKELKELNDATNDKLLDVLLTSDRLVYNSKLIYCNIGEKKIAIKKEVLNKNFTKEIRDYFEDKEFNFTQINTKTFDAMKAFVGYIYFDKLILKDKEDIQLIREVCRFSFILSLHNFEYKPFDECIANHLEKRITVENLQLISEIAFDYKLDSLKERVNQFNEQNLTEIFAKSTNI